MGRSSSLVAVVGTVVLIGSAISPALGAGFFETLFGPSPKQAAPPPPPFQKVYPRGDLRTIQRFHAIRKIHPAFHREKVAALGRPFSEKDKSAPVKCCASVAEAMRAISHDRTLQPGDLVMTERGLKIFVGASGGFHAARDFAAFRQTRGFSPDLRQSASLGRTKSAGAARSLTIFSQQSKSNHENDISLRPLDDAARRTVVDARGRRLRLVGGYSDLADNAKEQRSKDGE
jgi:hypothetical protein